MKNVDLFIAYLSGELNQEELASFKKELAGHPDMKAEFDQVSAAYHLIRDQLQERDEDAFKKQLLKIMEQPPKDVPHRSRRFKKGWYVILPLAASLAILLTIFFSSRNEHLLYTRFYDPDSDQVLMAYMQGTRGKAESGILHYQQEHYEESMKIMQELLEVDPENLLARLFFLLSAIETEKAEEALNKLKTPDPDLDHHIGQAIYWYTALALLQADQKDEAIKQLQSLIRQEGPYQSDAIRLEKILLK